MLRTIGVCLFTAAMLGTAHGAGEANSEELYVCKDNNRVLRLLRLHVFAEGEDNDLNNIVWKGVVYKLSRNSECGAYGWFAYAPGATPPLFSFCTGTKGFADLRYRSEKKKTVIECRYIDSEADPEDAK